MQRRSGSTVELTAVHRFRDPTYGALTLRLREPADHADALAVGRELAATGHVDLVSSEHEARERMVAAWLRHAAGGERVALVTATNAEAQQINDRIQQQRFETGMLGLDRVALGQDGQRLLIGDIVQTRRNDTDLGVDNRATWTVTRITRAGIRLASVTDSGDIRTVDHDYAAEHIHLAYASTVHGIQGETVHSSYVGPGVDAAGLYVGMTRGRQHNTAIAIARDPDQAIELLADTMMRGRLEVTLDDARRGSLSELGRAARPPEPVVRDPARTAWDRLDTARAAERAARARLREIDMEIAYAAAVGHARAEGSKAVDPQPPPAAERAAVQTQIDDAHYEVAALAQQHRKRGTALNPGQDLRHATHQPASLHAERELRVEPPVVSLPVSDPNRGLEI